MHTVFVGMIGEWNMNGFRARSRTKVGRKDNGAIRTM